MVLIQIRAMSNNTRREIYDIIKGYDIHNNATPPPPPPPPPPPHHPPDNHVPYNV